MVHHVLAKQNDHDVSVRDLPFNFFFLNCSALLFLAISELLLIIIVS